MDASLGWVDWAFLGVLCLSAVVGLVRGLVFEVLSLLGWVAAYFAAQWFAPADKFKYRSQQGNWREVLSVGVGLE